MDSPPQEDDEQFFDAQEEIKQDPAERSCLPYLKGHVDHKVSLWSVLKDSVGKEIWKITVPVLFNEPLGLLQKGANSCEFLDLLD